LALGVVGLLLLVTVAARGGHPTTSGAISTRPVPDTVQNSLITLLAIAYVVVILAIIVAVFRRHTWTEPKDSRWLRNFLTVLVLMAVATAIGTYAMKHGHLRQRADQARAGQAQQQSPFGRLRARPVPTRSAHFQWPLVLGLAGLFVLGGVLVYVRERRGPTRARAGATLEDDLAMAVEATIDDLRGERDPRRAVIAAYAQMERVLASHGIPRREAEAPLEYLSRILGDLHVGEDAVRSLTSLFEYAKFSPHEIDSAMKADAIEALIAVRDDLQREEVLAA